MCVHVCVFVFVCVCICGGVFVLLQVHVQSRSSLTNGKVHVFVGSVFPHVNPQLGFIGAHKVRQGNGW